MKVELTSVKKNARAIALKAGNTVKLTLKEKNCEDWGRMKDLHTRGGNS